jgi:hypothetical protein
VTDQFPAQLAADDLLWLNLGSSSQVTESDAARQSRTAKAILKKLFSADPSPGVILADEVGMGKTYEAFAVIAALLLHKHRSSVCVLAHSKAMADVWLDRWQRFRTEAIREESISTKIPKATPISNAEEIGSVRLTIGSYETVKLITPDLLDATLAAAMRGRGIHKPTRRHLARVIGRKSRVVSPNARFPKYRLNKFWADQYDKGTREWKSKWRAKQALRRLAFVGVKSKRMVHLLVVDEAHKVGARQRQMFLEEVLASRAHRALFLTATPFAMRVDELYERIRDIHEITNFPKARIEILRDELKRFESYVRRREDVPRDFKAQLEGEMRKFLIRSIWPEKLEGMNMQRRELIPNPVTPTLGNWQDALAQLGLETAFIRLLDAGARTHIATHRETLCSSYAAIKESDSTNREWVELKEGLITLLPSAPIESVKFEATVRMLLDAMRKVRVTLPTRKKIVVFCKRKETIKQLGARLAEGLKQELEIERKVWDRIRRRVRGKIGNSEELALLRLATYCFGSIARGTERAAIRRISTAIKKAGGVEGDYSDYLNRTWGPRRPINWIGEYSGQSGSSGHQKRDREVTRFAFNLPGPPYVLLCSEIAREGIDLHRWCRTIVHYDLDWNPAAMEQRVGRIDRIGSFSRRAKKPIEVCYAWMPQTYEEFIKETVEKRVAMMRVLLGAGEFLSDTPEAQNMAIDLEKYELDFAP